MKGKFEVGALTINEIFKPDNDVNLFLFNKKKMWRARVKFYKKFFLTIYDVDKTYIFFFCFFHHQIPSLYIFLINRFEYMLMLKH